MALHRSTTPCTGSIPRARALVAIVAVLACSALSTRAWVASPALADQSGASSAADRDDRIRRAYDEYKARIEANQLAEALGPAKRAYDYAQQELGVDDRGLATTAAAFGTLLLDLGRPLDALRPLTHARELYEHQTGPTSEGARAMQRRIAEANQELGRMETAERTWLDLIKRTKKMEGDPTPELAGIYARLQILTTEADADARSRRYGLTAMKLYRQSTGEDSLQVGLVTVKLGYTALELGEYNEAVDFLDHGVPILEKRLEPGDPQLTVLYEFLVELYEKAGDDGRARRYRVRLKKNRAQESTGPGDPDPS